MARALVPWRRTGTIIGAIEIGIGLATLAGLLVHRPFLSLEKPPAVFAFVFIAAVSSIILGCGLARRRGWSRVLLVFFSGYVVLTKLLVFAGLLEFKGELFTLFPTWLKNAISLTYHLLVIVILEQRRFKDAFQNP